MPLYAIRAKERMVYQIDDAKIYYRRLSLVERQQIDTRNTNDKGVRDINAVLMDILLACIVGWEGYVDPLTDEPIPFNPGNVEAHTQAIAALPTEVQTDLGQRAQAALAQRESSLKNLGNGSTAGTPSATLSQTPANGYRSLVTTVE